MSNMNKVKETVKEAVKKVETKAKEVKEDAKKIEPAAEKATEKVEAVAKEIKEKETNLVEDTKKAAKDVKIEVEDFDASARINDILGLVKSVRKEVSCNLSDIQLAKNFIVKSVKKEYQKELLSALDKKDKTPSV